MPILKPKFILFEISKAITIKKPKRGMTMLSYFRYFDFKGPKSWKIYAWNSHTMRNHNLRPNHALDQRIEENRPPFLWGGVCCLQLLIWALLRPQIAIRWGANISRRIFSWFWPLKIEKSEQKLYGHNPLRILNHSGC